jgi:GntR family transcriptional regulator
MQMSGQPDIYRDLVLRSGSPLPLYHQLRERLRSVALSADPGTLLPSEKELMAVCGVSRATVRRALADLINEGLLVAERGRGTFVAGRRVGTEIGGALKGFSDAMREAGLIPRTRLIRAELTTADDHIAARLGVEAGDDIVEIERLRLIDETPCMLERCHLPGAAFARILQFDLTESLYALLREHFGAVPTNGTESIMAINAEPRIAQLLRVPIAAALLATARSTMHAGRPLEYTLRQARGDLCSFYVNSSEGGSLLGSGDIHNPFWHPVAS